MEVDENYLRLDLLQKFIGKPEGIIAGGHKDASLEVEDSVTNAIFLSLIDAPARHASRKICRTQQSPRRTVRVAIRHLKVFDDLPLVPDMIARSHNVDAKIEEFVSE